MKKKNVIFLCVAVAVIAAFVGMKPLESHVSETSNLLKYNVEALTEGEEEPYPEERRACIDKGGNWKYGVRMRSIRIGELQLHRFR